ncbi:hypothetical protein HK102_012927 [Quaeritorhiza haematococci]|nr:hypothetical protein HK102_012927 [Quaeritorhiza haematococci]
MLNLTLLTERSTALFPFVSSTNESSAVAIRDAKITSDPETRSCYITIPSAAVEGVETLYKIAQNEDDTITVDELCVLRPESEQEIDGNESADPPAKVIGLTHLPDSQTLCVALRCGDINVIQLDGLEAGVEAEPEVVGTVDSGILAIEWSPDHELVVMVTGNGTLLQMTKDFEVIDEVPIHVDEKGEDVQVSLGWGKKETQFHGSEGRVGRERSLQELSQQQQRPSLSSSEDFRPKLSWRGDGNFFVCSVVDRNGVRRVLRVYNRDCVLQSTSEFVNQLEHTLSWRPSGNLIASSQLQPHRHDIVFFERNGLRHGEFALRETVPTKVKEIAWNVDSSVLALWIEREEANGRKQSAVQLWTTSNYYWYLKQEITAAKPLVDGEGEDCIIGFAWDVEVPLRLHVVTKGGVYRRLDYARDTFTSTSLSSQNPASVAVIDGRNILLTPFKYTNTPPPMSTFKIDDLPHPANHVVFGPGPFHRKGESTHAIGDNVAVLLSANGSFTVRCYESRSIQRPVKAPVFVGEFSLSTTQAGPVTATPTYRQLAWLTPSSFAVIEHLQGAEGIADIDRVVIIRLDRELNLAPKPGGSSRAQIAEYQVVDLHHWSVTNSKGSNRHVFRLHHSLALDLLLVELDDGAVFQLVSVDDGQQRTWAVRSHVQLPVVCPTITAVRLESNPASATSQISGSMQGHLPPASAEAPEVSHILVGLNDRNKLYAALMSSGPTVGESVRLLSTECTSFFVHNEFLIVTTFSHTARFLPLKSRFEEPTQNVPHSSANQTDMATKGSSAGAASAFDEHIRRVERGSRIVVAVAGDVSLVLQMPRGNLETICPRALVLSVVRDSLDRLDYRTAFVLCRKHRIDMNLLYDHKPAQFLAHVVDFVKQVDDPEYLNLFLSGLRNEDVTVTMYPNRLTLESEQSKPAQIIPPSSKDPSNKVTKICVSVRAALEAVEPKRYCHSILTTHVKEVPADLEAALRRIRSLKAEEGAEAAESALKYVIFLIDVDRLYDVALGMYDFALVLMVAQHSQKDPREYLPFLSDLQKLEKNMQRFQIDDFLGRHESALKHLSLTGDENFERCTSYITKHKLFKAAMEIFELQPEKYKVVLKLYADYLLGQSEHEEAGLLYRMAGAHSQAVDAFKAAGLWREALAVAASVSASGRTDAESTDLKALATGLADFLLEKHRYAEAARIFSEYLLNPEEAVKALVKGSQWDEAVRMSHLHGKSSYIDEVVKPGAYEAFEHMLADIDQMRTTFEKQTQRLQVVREEKARKLAQLLQFGHDESLDDIDIMSDTTSMVTSRVTGATSRISSVSTARTPRTSKGRRKQERKKQSARKGGMFEEEYLVSALKKSVEKSNEMRDDVRELVKVMLLFGSKDKARAATDAFSKMMEIMQHFMPTIFIAQAQPVETVDDLRRRIMGLDMAVPTTSTPPTNDAPRLSNKKWTLSVI